MSFRREKVTLSSGKQSDFYLDLRQTLMRPRGVALAGDLVFERLLAGPAVESVGGMAVGAVPLVTAVLAAAAARDPGTSLLGFFVRKEKKGHGSFRPDSALAIRSILVASIACVFFAALPLVLAAFGVSGSALWRSSSSALFLTSIGVVFYMVRKLRDLPATDQTTIFVRVGLSLAALNMLSLVANAIGWPLPPSAGLYLVSLWGLLGIASVNFLDLVFRGILGESAA